MHGLLSLWLEINFQIHARDCQSFLRNNSTNYPVLRFPLFPSIILTENEKPNNHLNLFHSIACWLNNIFKRNKTRSDKSHASNSYHGKYTSYLSHQKS